jgi:hypothetical protein
MLAQWCGKNRSLPDTKVKVGILEANLGWQSHTESEEVPILERVPLFCLFKIAGCCRKSLLGMHFHGTMEVKAQKC